MNKNELKTKTSNVKTKPRECSWNYYVKCNGNNIDVCRTFFLKTFQISVKRLRVIQDKLKQGTIDMSDMRGKHTNRPNKISNDVYVLALEHLEKIPHKKSHYTNSKRFYFENTDLNIKIIYRKFRKYYYKQTKSKLKMKYSTYTKWFQESSPYSIKQPRTDTCDFCTECKTKLSIRKDDPCQGDYDQHRANVEKYKEMKRKILDKCAKKSNYSTLVLEFDYAQNLPLPKITVSSQFYKRLMWMYIFNVHCHNDSNSTFYWMLEHNGNKSSNSVVSLLFNFLENYLQKEEIGKIILFSDGCGGQNKNHTVVKFCSWLSKTYNISIEHIFPVRGHSYNQCDRNFGCYGKNKKRKENVYTVDTYLEMLRACRQYPSPFNVTEGSSLIRDWSSVLQNYTRRVPYSKKSKFTLQKYVSLSYSNNGEIECSQTYCKDGKTKFVSLSEKFSQKKLHNVITKLQCIDSPGMKTEKVKDLKSLMKFIPEDAQKWFNDSVFSILDT